MPDIKIDKTLCALCGECITACPFGAIEQNNDIIEINAACKLCKICVKKCPAGAISFNDTAVCVFDKSEWRDILVFGEMENGALHPVTYELIGKALSLASSVSQTVHCVIIGEGSGNAAHSLKGLGLDKILLYDSPAYRFFTADVYASAFEDAVKRLKPSAVLVGATAPGRSLAPRLSARFRTGLTADCTALEMRPEGDLVQIRPAFGGDIMARILTPHTRPQFATIRYKTMDRAAYLGDESGEITVVDFQPPVSRAEPLAEHRREASANISDAEIIIVAGRGIRSQKDLEMLESLTRALGGQLAGTRPLIEAGWLPYTRQIGLSGRTVKPRLIITCGVSGAVQFTAAMRETETIIAINTDPGAPIFNIAHICVPGDVYEIAPELIRMLKGAE